MGKEQELIEGVEEETWQTVPEGGVVRQYLAGVDVPPLVKQKIEGWQENERKKIESQLASRSNKPQELIDQLNYYKQEPFFAPFIQQTKTENGTSKFTIGANDNFSQTLYLDGDRSLDSEEEAKRAARTLVEYYNNLQDPEYVATMPQYSPEKGWFLPKGQV